jgi:hypothetical protein
MRAEAREIEARLARELARDRVGDLEVRRWLETLSRALETVLAQPLPIDGAGMGNEAWNSPS